MNQVEELEAAILARADRLATEYRERAQRSRDRILREAADQLHLREEREVLLAKSLAERNYRRKVQSSELKLHAHMDHLRWNLVRGVEQRLKQRMDTYLDDEESYFAVLKGYLAQGVRLIERERLVAQVNARDLKRLIESWDDFAAATAAADKTVVLSREPLETVGGMLIRSEDGRIRVDNTFEGRLERLRPQLHQIIVERLMPAAVDRLGV